MAGLVPAIHVGPRRALAERTGAIPKAFAHGAAWMPGTSPGMTERVGNSDGLLSHEGGNDGLARAREALSQVCDPELPVLTIADLGVLRDVRLEGEAVVVEITPTYSGCPAMSTIALDVELALARAGFAKVKIETVLSPAWTTDWMSEEGRAKLLAYGIAPPAGRRGRRALFGQDDVACPRCGSHDTERLAEFGSTSCKALWRCRACREPFDYFKCH